MEEILHQLILENLPLYTGFYRSQVGCLGFPPSNSMIDSLSHYFQGFYTSRVVQEFFHQQYDGWWLVPRWFFVLPMPACQERLLGFKRLLKQYWQNLPKMFENDDSSAFLSTNFLCPKHSPISLSPQKNPARQNTWPKSWKAIWNFGIDSRWNSKAP